MITQDETGHIEIVIPLCPWCEEPLSGACENGLHIACAVEAYREMEAVAQVMLTDMEIEIS